MINLEFLFKIIKYPAEWLNTGYPRDLLDAGYPDIRQKSISGQIISGDRISGPTLVYTLYVEWISIMILLYKRDWQDCYRTADFADHFSLLLRLDAPISQEVLDRFYQFLPQCRGYSLLTIATGIRDIRKQCSFWTLEFMKMKWIFLFS